MHLVTMCHHIMYSLQRGGTVNFLKSASLDPDGEMSATGWSNPDVFNNHLTKNLLNM